MSESIRSAEKIGECYRNSSANTQDDPHDSRKMMSEPIEPEFSVARQRVEAPDRFGIPDSVVIILWNERGIRLPERIERPLDAVAATSVLRALGFVSNDVLHV